MAEGGDGKDENPFSFKKFVTKQGTDSPTRQNDPKENEQNSLNLDLPDISSVISRENDDEPRRSSKEDFRKGSKEDTRKCGKDENNPFSFKKFLQAGSGTRTASNGPTSISTLDLANDLPDFVQDHFTGTIDRDSPRSRHRGVPSRVAPPSDVPLPDFALDTAIGSIPRDRSPQQNIHKYDCQNTNSEFPYRTGEPPCDIGDSSCSGPILDSENISNLPRVPSPSLTPDPGGSDDEIETQPRFCQTTSGGLPDFLPDSVLGSAGARPKVLAGNADSRLLFNSERNQNSSLHNGIDQNTSLIAQIQQLREENNELKQQLEEVTHKAEQEAKRVNAVKEEKDTFQQRDAEETAALENIVAQVEENLRTTTERAVKAETTVTKLKQDVKRLQNQINRVQAENEVLHGAPRSREGPQSRDPLYDKTAYAAEQLTAAANTAEQQLKHLLSGIDQLKLVAEFLRSADKVTDISPEEASGPLGAEGGATL